MGATAKALYNDSKPVVDLESAVLDVALAAAKSDKTAGGIVDEIPGLRTIGKIVNSFRENMKQKEKKRFRPVPGCPRHFRHRGRSRPGRVHPGNVLPLGKLNREPKKIFLNNLFFKTPYYTGCLHWHVQQSHPDHVGRLRADVC